MKALALILSLSMSGQTVSSTCAESLTECHLHRLELREAALRFRSKLELCEAQRTLAATPTTSLAADALRDVRTPEKPSTPAWVWPTIAIVGVLAFVGGVLVAPHTR